MKAAVFADVLTAKVNGTTLAYRERGSGEPVVFVHGGISDLRAWDAQLPEVGRSYRAISYSRRHAQPNEPLAADSMDPIGVHVDDLAAFVREIGAEPAHLVGNSWGALICLLTAVRHPGVARSLVLEEPPAVTLLAPTVPPRLGDLARLIATRPRTALALFSFLLGTISRCRRAYARGDEEEGVRIFAQGVLGRKPLEQIPEAVRAQLIENRDQLRPLMLHPEPDPLRLEADSLRRLEVPALLLTGELSATLLLHLTDRLEELLPRVERREIRGASHIMHAEDPGAVNAVILDFLARQRRT